MYINSLCSIVSILDSAENFNVSSSAYPLFQYTVSAVVDIYVPFSTTVMRRIPLRSSAYASINPFLTLFWWLWKLDTHTGFNLGGAL
jgi:hypothetical protein